MLTFEGDAALPCSVGHYCTANPPLPVSLFWGSTQEAQLWTTS